MFHLNARSLKTKLDEVDLFLNDLNYSFDILCFTETWFSSDDECAFLDGYDCISVCRAFKRGGGSAMYIRSHFKYNALTEYNIINENIECVVVQLYDILLGVFYRPPSGSLNHFLNCMEELFELSLELKLQCAFVGDFNLNVSSDTSGYSRLQELFVSYACCNLIDMPTRITPTSQSILDLCITSFPPDVVKSGVLKCDLSDHLPIYCILPHKRPNSNKQPVFIRHYSGKISANSNIFSQIKGGTPF